MYNKSSDELLKMQIAGIGGIDSGGISYQSDGMAAGQPEFSDHPGLAMGDGSFVSWVVDQSGVGNVGRQTAQGLYNLCTPIPKAYTERESAAGRMP